MANLSNTLTDAQARRRMIRQKLAEAAGLVKPGEIFHAYGPHKTQGADQLLKGGTGIGKGLGAAQRQELLLRRRKTKRATATPGKPYLGA